MHISIEETILSRYPFTEIGYMVASVHVRKSDPIVEELKLSLSRHIQQLGIQATNFVAHPKLAIWRRIYKDDFQVKESAYRSSLEALLRRVVTGKKMWDICNVVDLYNCCSVLSLLPMGGYDLGKIQGDIAIRYAHKNEPFYGIGEREPIQATSNHVVYADNQRLLCWLWNHKDAQDTCINESTKQVIFFIDSADGHNTDAVAKALEHLAMYLERIECVPGVSGILNIKSSHVTLPVRCGVEA